MGEQTAHSRPDGWQRLEENRYVAAGVASAFLIQAKMLETLSSALGRRAS
jgi:hypothetical protein